jgi:hypothetical protein
MVLFIYLLAILLSINTGEKIETFNDIGFPDLVCYFPFNYAAKQLISIILKLFRQMLFFLEFSNSEI